jgi:hypothetical protein
MRDSAGRDVGCWLIARTFGASEQRVVRVFFDAATATLDLL